MGVGGKGGESRRGVGRGKKRVMVKVLSNVVMVEIR